MPRRTEKLSTSAVDLSAVKFRLRTVVFARRHLATRQCHNKHASWWELMTARSIELTKLCHGEQEGECVSVQWSQDIRSALQREVKIGLDEAMEKSPADDGWTKEQWEQILINPQQFDLEDLEEVRANAMERAKACAKKIWQQDEPRVEGVGSSGDEPRRQACTQMDWEDWSHAALGRGGDQWYITFLHAS